MTKDQTQSAYDKILSVVCKELGVTKRDVMSSTHETNAVFARVLYVQISKDLGLNAQRAVILINKSRPMLRRYTLIAGYELQYNQKRLDQYQTCCKKLGVKIKQEEPTEDVKQAVESSIRKEIGKLPKNNHYTMAEEIAMARVREAASRFMRNYGKGTNPLLAGHAITRKKR